MKTLVAVTQITSTKNIKENIENCERVIEQAVFQGARLVSLPENFAFFGDTERDATGMAETIDGPIINHFKELARRLNIWLSLGGFPEKNAETKKVYNCHLVIDAKGEIAAAYRKMHLFSVSLPDGTSYRESDAVTPGYAPVTFSSPFFVGGLTICYDLRFSNLFTFLSDSGAQVIFVPAAFTQTTGRAHWEVLLRARAIETQSYVVASAQCGRHSAKRKTYGHAMIVDPWGRVIAACGENASIAVAEIDLGYLSTIRKNMPIKEHRRKIKEDHNK